VSTSRVAFAALLFTSPLVAAAQKTPVPRWATAIDSMMQREMARTHTPGAQIVIVEHGRVAYAKGYGVADVETGRAVTERTLFQTGSLSKLFTGVLVAELAAREIVDPHAPISRYVPELAGREVGGATLHELLTHTAGWRGAAVPWGRSDDAALGEVFRALGDTVVVPGLRGLYSYSNIGFEMAAYVTERATGRPFATLLDSVLFVPLGMTRSTIRPLVALTRDFSLGHAAAAGAAGVVVGAPSVVRPMPGNSAEWGASFIWVNAPEAARLAMAMMDGGMLDGTRVLAADAVRAVTTAVASRPSDPTLHVGYGMNTDSVGGRRVWQKGGLVAGYRALMTMWPADRLAVVVLVNLPTDMTYRATARAAQTVGEIAPMPTPAVVEREPSVEERRALVGSYRMGIGTMEILDTAGRLEARLPLRRGVRSVPIRMTGVDRFVMTPAAEPIEFVVGRDTTGAVRWLYGGETTYPRVGAP
jgi:CubicO group peptidase (beta-lactamase class C family)